MFSEKIQPEGENLMQFLFGVILLVFLVTIFFDFGIDLLVFLLGNPQFLAR